MSIDEFDQGLGGLLTSSSPSEQILYWNKYSEHLLSCIGKSEKDERVRLMSFFLKDRLALTAGRYTDHKARLSVLHTIKKLFREYIKLGIESELLKIFFAFTSKSFDNLCKNASPTEGCRVYSSASYLRFAYFSWLDAVIFEWILAKGGQAVSTEFMLLHGNYADSLLNDQKYKNSVKYRLEVIAGKSLDYVHKFIIESAKLKSLSTCSSFGLYASAVPADSVIDPVVLSYIHENIITSRSAVPSFMCNCYSKFLERCNAQQFKDVLMKDCEKVILRSPEVFFPNLYNLVRFISFDASSIFLKIHESIVKQFKSSNERYRQDAYQLYGALATRCSDLGNTSKIVHSCFKLLGDKSFGQDSKLLIAKSFSLFAANRSDEIKVEVINQLSLAVATESSDAVLCTCISSLRTVLETLYVFDDEKVLKLTIGGISPSSKDQVRTAFLRLLSSCAVKFDLLKQSKQLFDSILKIANTFQKIAISSYTVDGLLSVKILCDIAVGNSRSITDQPVISESVIFSDKHYSKFVTLADSGIDDLLSSWMSYLRRYSSVMSEAQLRTALGCICKVYTDSSHSIFRKVDNCLKELLKDIFIDNSDKFGCLLLEMMEKQLLDGPVTQTDLDLIQYRSHRMLKTLITFPDITEGQSVGKHNRLIALILICCSELVSSSETDLSVWPRIAHDAGCEDISSFISISIQEIEKIVFSFGNQVNSCRGRACLKAIRLMSKLSPLKMGSIFMSRMNQLASAISEEFKAGNLTEESIHIWAHDPADSPYVDVLSRNSDGQSSNRAGGNSLDKWEKDLRQELENKKSKSAKLKQLSKDEMQKVKLQLEAESEVRDRVQRIVSNGQMFIAILKSIGLGNTDVVRHNYPHIAEGLLRLLQLCSPISSDSGMAKGFDICPKVYEMLTFTGRCLSKSESKCELSSLADMIVSIIFIHHGYYGSPEYFAKFPVEDLLFDLLERLSGCVVGPEAFSFVFAGLSSGLELVKVRHAKQTGSEEKADRVRDIYSKVLMFVNAHTAAGHIESMPRLGMINFLLDTMSIYPAFVGIGQEALRNLVSSMGETSTDDEIRAILAGLLSDSWQIRRSVLESCAYLEVTEGTVGYFTALIWISTQEEHEDNAKLAKQLWIENEMEIGPSFRFILSPLLKDKCAAVRLSTAKAISEGLKIHPQSVTDTMHLIYQEYTEMVKPPSPKYDDYGILIPESLDRPDDFWWQREGYPLTIYHSCTHFSEADVFDLLTFLTSSPGAFADDNEKIRERMVEAALKCIECQGKKYADQLLLKLHEILNHPPAPTTFSSSNKLAQDMISESSIILLGSTCKFLSGGDERVPTAIRQLIKALETPSESVQIAVGICLGPLMKLYTGPDLSIFIDQLFDMLLNGEKYGKRRGGAFGIAGVVKGLGMGCMKEYRVMDRLQEASESKKWETVQGSMFAFETMSGTLGPAFEPYIMQILPFILSAFGNSNNDVREAASDCSRIISSILSSHAVKLILPTILAGLSDYKWRTKVASIEFLGAMAYLAPKQLSLSLPTIVPKLTEVLTDSHVQVQKAARAALEKFSSVIQNPEIKSKIEVLLKALADPAKETNNALQVLEKKGFSNRIDGASLALLVPIIERGLKERSTETKKMASLITGRLASLTDPKDVNPYLPLLQPLLREVLIDPVPEARAISAQAFGKLVQQMGEANFPTLVNELMDVLLSDASSVDRQGAAQGLAEIIFGLGTGKLDEMLSLFLQYTKHERPYVRESFMSLFVYLPETFGDLYQKYLPDTVPYILNGLADEYEFVRDSSMKAGRVIVSRFSKNAVELLLPQLERGLFDHNWRIRISSLQLLGDFLYKLSGVTGKAVQTAGDGEDDEDDTLGTETGKKAIVKIIGTERFNHVMASVYLSRCDNHAVVRQSAVQVWKAVVTNTPRALKEIMPHLMGMLVDGLASANEDRRQTSATALGDLSQKLGELIMLEVVPWLGERFHSSSGDDRVREGAVIGLAEILGMASKHNILNHTDLLLPLVKEAIVDPCRGVREAAANAYDHLNELMGAKAVDEIILPILHQLESGHGGEFILEGLKQVISVRNSIFTVLLPSLITPPISSAKAKALLPLIEVGGSMIAKKQTQILRTLIDQMAKENTESLVDDIIFVFRALVRNVDEDSMHQLMIVLYENVKPACEKFRRKSACLILRCLCEETSASGSSAMQVNLNVYRPEWMKILLGMYDERLSKGRDLVEEASKAMDALLKSVRTKDELDNYIPYFRKGVAQITGELVARGLSAARLDGMNLNPKSPQIFLPMLLQGLLYGPSSDVREQTANAMNDLISLTDVDVLKPYIIQLTGPLIRIMGEKFGDGVKRAIMDDFILLLRKCPQLLKPFFPQLQRTLVKSLQHVGEGTTQAFRDKAAEALGEFIKTHTNIDALLKELEKALQTAITQNDAAAAGVCEALIKGCWQILSNTGSSSSAAPGKVTEVTLQSLANTIMPLILPTGSGSGSSGTLKQAAGVTFGLLISRRSSKDSAKEMLQKLLQTPTTTSLNRVAVLQAINSYLAEATTEVDLDDTWLNQMQLKNYDGDDGEREQLLALECTGRLLLKQSSKDHSGALVQILRDGLAQGRQSSVRKLSLQILASVPLSAEQKRQLLPRLGQMCMRERKNIPVKMAAEKCLIALFHMSNGAEFEDALNSLASLSDRKPDDLTDAELKQFKEYGQRILTRLAAKSTSDSVSEVEWQRRPSLLSLF